MSDKKRQQQMCVRGGRKQTTKPPCTRVCQGIDFHANSARARANPAPNTPAGWSRVAWFGFEDELVEEEVVVPVVVGDVVVVVPPVVVVVGRVPVVEDTAEVVPEPGKSVQHCCARTNTRYRLPEAGTLELAAVCHMGVLSTITRCGRTEQRSNAPPQRPSK